MMVNRSDAADSQRRMTNEDGGAGVGGSEGRGDGDDKNDGGGDSRRPPLPPQEQRSVSWRSELVSDAWSVSSHGSGARRGGDAVPASVHSPPQRRRHPSSATSPGRRSPDAAARRDGGAAAPGALPLSSAPAAPTLIPETPLGGGGGGGSALASSSPNRYATEIVRSLFPPSPPSHPHPVSPVLVDHPCSYRRSSGRLYVSITDLCFYSNLFGRETRVRVELGKAAYVREDGRTGVAVLMMEGEGEEMGAPEEYLFKGLKKREEVYQLILTLHARATGQRIPSPPTVGIGGGEASTVSEAAARQRVEASSPQRGEGSASSAAAASAVVAALSLSSERTASPTSPIPSSSARRARTPPRKTRTPPRSDAGGTSAASSPAEPLSAAATSAPATGSSGAVSSSLFGRSQSADSLPSPGKKDSSASGPRSRASSDGAVVAPAAMAASEQSKGPMTIGRGRDEDDWALARSSALSAHPELALDRLLVPCGGRQRRRSSGGGESSNDKDGGGSSSSSAIDAFRLAFLSDSAPYPISSYMSSPSIGDMDVSPTPWSAGSDEDRGPVETRTIEFRHPLNSAFAPSFVNSKKRQSMRTYGGRGAMVLESETTIEGRTVPGAGRFRVEEVWIVEEAGEGEGEGEGEDGEEKKSGEAKNGEGDDDDKGSAATTSVALTVRFSVNFDPDVNGALKRMIASRSKSETKEWYKGYRTFLLDALAAEAQKERAEGRGGGGDKAVVVRSSSELSRDESLAKERENNLAMLARMGSTDMRHFWIASGLAVLLFAVPLAALANYVWALTDRVAELEGDLAEVREALAKAVAIAVSEEQ